MLQWCWSGSRCLSFPTNRLTGTSVHLHRNRCCLARRHGWQSWNNSAFIDFCYLNSKTAGKAGRSRAGPWRWAWAILQKNIYGEISCLRIVKQYFACSLSTRRAPIMSISQDDCSWSTMSYVLTLHFTLPVPFGGWSILLDFSNVTPGPSMIATTSWVQRTTKLHKVKPANIGYVNYLLEWVWLLGQI